MDSIKKIGIIGAGNVASHLAQALHAAGMELPVIAARTLSNVEELANKYDAKATTHIQDLSTYSLDLIILAVPDSVIEVVSGQIGDVDAAVVHTSGAVSVQMLNREGRLTGIFYPLQTLTKGSSIDMKGVPMCVDAVDDHLRQLLHELAGRISNLVYRVNDEQRKWLHLAAVLINNNINHILARVEDLIVDQSIDRNILHPLLTETIRKAGSSHPALHQTGPAVRGDESTKQVHLNLLRKYGDDQLIELYTYFWRSIQEYNSDDISRKG
ncbi:MAG: DUF2520 domain-containing protein [Bacteroidetes bacterium]|nr:DUF2520 domain-containing protein [Bacteroidota bacterium]